MPEIIKYQTKSRKTKEFDISTEGLSPFGDFRHGERYRHPQFGEATVVGVCEAKSG